MQEKKKQARPPPQQPQTTSGESSTQLENASAILIFPLSEPQSDPGASVGVPVADPPTTGEVAIDETKHEVVDSQASS